VGPRALDSSIMAITSNFSNYNGKFPNSRIVMANLQNAKIVMASIKITLIQIVPIITVIELTV
jgi:hypothetical protein